jgi:putative ATP-dependent endonuclease of the OLD family
MTISFRPDRLIIHNFRGIENLEVSFPATVPTILIGSNNTCKSTVLNAFALALRSGGFHQWSPEAYDFFHSVADGACADFSIALHFRPATGAELPAVQAVGNPTFVHGVNVQGRTEKSGRFIHRHWLLDDAGKPNLLMPRTLLKGETKQVFGEQDFGPFRRYATLDDIRQYLPTVWLLRPDNISASLYKWASGPLQRLSKMLANRFLNEQWEFEHQGHKRKMPDTLVRAHQFFQETVAAFPFWKNDLRPNLEKVLSGYLGRQASIDLRPDIQAMEEWLAQQLLLSFAADAGGVPTPLDRMGDGWQSIIRLAALEVLSLYPSEVREWIVVLLEEPETHLHPHLRRKFRSVLHRLSALNWTVLVTTHSPEFVSFAQNQQIVRLSCTGNEIAAGVLLTTNTADEAKFQEKIDQYGNHEVLLAASAVFCEGKDDAFAIRLGLSKLGVETDTRALSVLDVGSCSTIPAYSEMAGKLKIPWCGVTDEDLLADGTVNPTTARDRARIDSYKTAADESLVWPGSLEACFDLTKGKATPAWQATNIEPLTLTQLDASYPRFTAVCRSIQSWLGQ